MASTVMIVPHPCQCYHGDNFRPFLTVAPVTEVPDYQNFGPDHSRANDKFALLDLPTGVGPGASRKSHVANFGRLTSVGRDYITTTKRIACLGHMGLGLLAKRLLQFQLRAPSELANVMAFTQKQWHESFLMQAWVKTAGSLKGYSEWLGTYTKIEGLGDDVRPDDYLLGALEILIAAVTGRKIPAEWA